MTASTSYTFQVVAVNTQGNSEPSATLTTSTSAYNAATGGSVQTFARTGLGTWKSHTFTSTGTLAVTVANEAFSGVALAGGQGGGYSHPADPRGPGSNGGASSSTTLTIATGNTTCTVGGGGGGGQGTHQSGNPGGASSIGSYLSSGGGSVTVAFYNGSNTTWAGNGYGGGGAAAYLSPGATGQGGIVFVAYRSS